jgi:hypothetical protein
MCTDRFKYEHTKLTAEKSMVRHINCGRQYNRIRRIYEAGYYGCSTRFTYLVDIGLIIAGFPLFWTFHSELVMFPRQAASCYFRRMFGDSFAFLYGWAVFSVINTAAVAAISLECSYVIIFCTYKV